MKKGRHSAAYDFKSRWFYIISLIIVLFILSSCAQPRVGPPPTGEEAGRIIEVEAVDQIVHYQCQSRWSEEIFSQISEDDLKARFTGKI